MTSRPVASLCVVALIIILSHPSSAQNSSSPEWVRSAVFYQIFPERFRNGDPSNDPTPLEIQGSWPHITPPATWKPMSWTGDWYEQVDWEKETGRDFYYTNQMRRYGGDLQGVIDKLDYLRELGITAIYFNPLFESPSLHKYDAALFHHIDNDFGPDPAKDRETWESENPADPSSWKWTSADSLFLRVIGECHKRGIRVIIDGVFNHTGMNFWALQDVIQNQQASKYRDWFTIKKWDDSTTTENEFEYEGWFGVKELPELREDDRGLIPPVREHVFRVVRRWMDPNGDGDPSDGIDGWRLDVAEKVSLEFWREFRKVVKGINPQAYIVGEVWWEDWQNNKMFDPSGWLKGDVFDAVMNYRWAEAVKNLFIDKDPGIPPSEFVRRLATIRQQEHGQTSVMLNLMDSHDTDRLASMVVNPEGWYDHQDMPRDDSTYQVRKPLPEEIAIQKQIIVFQMTYPGAPCIYYGDEAGMWGADDPDDRKPMVWADTTYADEVSHPMGKQRPKDKVVFDADLFAFYKSVIALRKNHVILLSDSLSFPVVDDKTRLLVTARERDGLVALVAFNLSDKSQRIKIPAPKAENWQDVLEHRPLQIKKSSVTIELPARKSAIIIGQPE